MKKRRNYLIHKKFQLKTAFSIILVTTILSVLILIAISMSIAFNNEKINNIIRVEDNIFQAMATSASLGQNSAGIQEMSKDHINNFNMVSEIIYNNRLLLIVLAAFIILQGIILYLMMIRKTHRIAGPIYVMSNYFNDIINGHYPNPRSLRKNDEFTEFYDLFIKLVDTLKTRENKK